MGTVWQESTVSHDYGVISVYRAGAGPPLLLLHGGPGDDSFGLRQLGQLLLPNHLVILFDQRGAALRRLTNILSAHLRYSIFSMTFQP